MQSGGSARATKLHFGVGVSLHDLWCRELQALHNRGNGVGSMRFNQACNSSMSVPYAKSWPLQCTRWVIGKETTQTLLCRPSDGHEGIDWSGVDIAIDLEHCPWPWADIISTGYAEAQESSDHQFFSLQLRHGVRVLLVDKLEDLKTALHLLRESMKVCLARLSMSIWTGVYRDLNFLKALLDQEVPQKTVKCSCRHLRHHTQKQL